MPGGFRPYGVFKLFDLMVKPIQCFGSDIWALSTTVSLNKRTMMVLYRSPECQVVKVYNGYKYQIS